MEWMNRLFDFLRLNGLKALVVNHQLTLSSLLTLQGIEALISPIFPLLLVFEILVIGWLYRGRVTQFGGAYKLPVLMYILNAVIAALININIFIWTQQHFSALAPYTVPMRIRWFIYAYVVWELSHYIYHWSCHKVRLLWVLHAPHHAPTTMNIGVIYAANFLQGTYAGFVRTAICSLLGVPIDMLILCMVIDTCWGSLIHFSEELWPSGKFGFFLDKLIMTPSDHRVHHASNREYIDTNYCNTLPLWDKLFGTLKRVTQSEKIKYGLTRPQKPNSLVDAYFGDIYLLWRDLKKARSWKDRLLYFLMPPGWHPTYERAHDASLNQGQAPPAE